MRSRRSWVDPLARVTGQDRRWFRGVTSAGEGLALLRASLPYDWRRWRWAALAVVFGAVVNDIRPETVEHVRRCWEGEDGVVVVGEAARGIPSRLNTAEGFASGEALRFIDHTALTPEDIEAIARAGMVPECVVKRVSELGYEGVRVLTPSECAEVVRLGDAPRVLAAMARDERLRIYVPLFAERSLRGAEHVAAFIAACLREGGEHGGMLYGVTWYTVARMARLKRVNCSLPVGDGRSVGDILEEYAIP